MAIISLPPNTLNLAPRALVLWTISSAAALEDSVVERLDSAAASLAVTLSAAAHSVAEDLAGHSAATITAFPMTGLMG